MSYNPLKKDVYKNKPLVSIVMNCYNGSDYLEYAISSVLNQTYENWELIFWDNASTDRSLDIVKSFKDTRIKYFQGIDKVSLGEARNFALKKAKGEFIAFLDTDDLWQSDKLLLQVRLLLAKPKVALVYSNFYTLGSNHKQDINTLRAHFLLTNPSGYVFRKFLKRYPINLQTVMIRHNLLIEENIEFDISLEITEEFDLFMRLLFRHEAAYISKVLAGYRLHENQNSVTQIHLFPAEMSYILKRFKKDFKNFREDFSKEISFLEAKIDYYSSRAFVHQGDPDEALKLLKKNRTKGFKFFILYWILNISPRLFRFVHLIRGRFI